MKNKTYQVIITSPVGVFRSLMLKNDEMETFMLHYNSITTGTEGFVSVPYRSNAAIMIPGNIIRNSIVEMIEFDGN